MSDERRMKEEPDLPPGLADALDAGRDDLPSEAEVRALEASVLAALGGGGGGPEGGSGGEGAAKAAKAANAVQLSFAGVVVTTVALVALWSATRPPEVAESVAVQEDAAVAIEDAGVASIDAGVDAPIDAGFDAPIEARARAARIDAGVRGATEVEVVGPRTVEEARVLDELALLRAARSALRRDPAEALALTEQMGAVPSPAWAEERERVAIEALHALGRGAEARGRFERFVERFPGSAYRERLEAILDRP